MVFDWSGSPIQGDYYKYKHLKLDYLSLRYLKKRVVEMLETKTRFTRFLNKGKL